MKLFVDAKNLAEVERDIGESVGQLLTPLTYRRNFRPAEPFGIDNGCFATFKKKEYFNLLKRELPNVKNCRFVCIPDVVGSARRTLELFEEYSQHPLINKFPKALVAQDGFEDLPIEWHLIDAIFIGGTDRFKQSEISKQIIQCAKRLDKYVHAGRVNAPARWEWFEELGVDSCDGTGLAQYSHMRWAIFRQKSQPKLFTEGR